MADCIGDKFPLGRSALYYVIPEGPFVHPDGATPTQNGDEFGTVIYPATTDVEKTGGRWTATHAIAPLACTMTFEQERSFTESATGGRGRQKDRVISGKAKAGWSLETYLEVAASGSNAGPDTWFLFWASLGSFWNSDKEPGADQSSATTTAVGNPKRYIRFQPEVSGGNCLPTFNLRRVVPGIYGECVFGCAVDTMTISMSSGDPIKCSFAGQAYGHTQTAKCTAVAGVNYSTLADAAPLAISPIHDVYCLTPGQETYTTNSYLGVDTGAASTVAWVATAEQATGGYLYTNATVAAKAPYNDEDAGKIAWKQGAAGKGPNDSSSNTDTGLVPFVPVGKTTFATTKPIASTQGEVSITPYKSDDSGTHAVISNAPITSLEITVTNNIKAIDDQAFDRSSFSGFIPGMRDITGTISMRLKSDVAFMLLQRRELFRKSKVKIKLGDTGSRYVQIDMAYVEFEPSAIEVSGQDEMTVSLPFKSLITSNAEADTFKDMVMEWK